MVPQSGLLYAPQRVVDVVAEVLHGPLQQHIDVGVVEVPHGPLRRAVEAELPHRHPQRVVGAEVPDGPLRLIVEQVQGGVVAQRVGRDPARWSETPPK